MDTKSIEAEIRAVRWFHAFEVLPGIITPGISSFDPKATLDSLGAPQDMTGKKCLDVGTWDGPLAFEMEVRGAEVYALDVQDPACTGFNTAKRLRGSEVQYTQGSVYDIATLFPGMQFDYITYFGVYYHLKNPIGAFEAISQALQPGGQLYLEGEVLINYSETYSGKPSTLDNKTVGQSDVPLTVCYPGKYKGSSNWFVPNLVCLKGWLEVAGLDLVFYEFNVADEKPYPRQRLIGTAVRAEDLTILEETNLFGESLSMSEEWFQQYVGLSKRRYLHTNSSGQQGGKSRSGRLPFLSLDLAQMWTRLVERVGWGRPPFEVNVQGQKVSIWSQMSSPTPRFTYVPSMLTEEENQLLYWATREYYSGRGCIVDAGPFLGGSTAPLCVGLQDNHRNITKQRRVHSFDQFVNDSSTYASYLQRLGEEVVPGGSFQHIFERLMTPFAEHMCVHAGNLCDLPYEAGPIEILFVDVANTWELNASVVSKFFRHLIPGRSLVIQQDYLHFYFPWVIITMWFFRKYFVFRGQVEHGHSVVFEYMRKIPDSLLDTDLRSLPVEQKRKAFETELERVSGWQRVEVLTGYIRVLLEEGEVDLARNLLQSMPAEAYNHPINQAGLRWIPHQLLDHKLPRGFDEQTYFELNPDVARSGIRAATHYVLYGAIEQRPWQKKRPSVDLNMWSNNPTGRERYP